MQELVDTFQTQKDIPVFLLTSQVGGLGLTLTAADRVVILDPAWNPSLDNQSVDRAYRIGQSKDVVVSPSLPATKLKGRKRVELDSLSFPAFLKLIQIATSWSVQLKDHVGVSFSKRSCCKQARQQLQVVCHLRLLVITTSAGTKD